ncbi:unnamed protein product [Zymoseptoria tritici ST99CH_3D7]|uniref:SprT-like domain-containing protein n=1 Tax=Zymoseptoria tritici (strain ST99CH_3D7) TaxID=1276538 RepID=A0A1X7RC12_ZYMT9|nr:unnamed protein product [Zymoseptoria tritici ST99CH_3D7]
MSKQAKKDRRIANAAREAWQACRKTKILPPLSRLKTYNKPYENGQTWRPSHDEEATNATVAWMNGEWDKKRIEAWNLWIEVYFPTLCEASQTGTMEALFHSQDGYQSVMEQVVQCIDEAIFGGRLAPYCKVELLDEAGTLGATKRIGPAEIVISLNLGLVKNVFQIYETILHELCHVHEFILGCCEGQLCRVCVSDFTFAFEKWVHHSNHFLELSWHVQEFASRLHHRELDLGRALSYTRDCDKHRIIPEHPNVEYYFTRPMEFEHVNLYRVEYQIAEGMETEAWEKDILPVNLLEGESLDPRLQQISARDLAKAIMPIKRPQKSSEVVKGDK